MTYYEKNTNTIILKNSKREGLHFIGWSQGFSKTGKTREEVVDALRKEAWTGWNTFVRKGKLIGRNLYRKPTDAEFAKRKAWHEDQEARALATIIEIEAR